ncbi:unnamed protein product [Phytophthora fragariaefolia]|uniref:Unnamed protein product n=1 Tax=Phytophthora fragariaefolia TaxID=1490495 RepID=A0A9W6UDW9_9STRA|nr:unnamed protein product [Phytophthora fragariaefolia]
MTKPRTRSTTASTATTIAKELRARLDADEDDEHAVLRAQVEFWNRLCSILAANDAAVGLEALDTLALAVLAEDGELSPLLDRAVVILPHPDAALRGEVPARPLFTFIASPYHGKRSSARGSSKVASPAKQKQRQLRRAPTILQNLPVHVSAKLRADLEQLEQAAAEQGMVVVRLHTVGVVSVPAAKHSASAKAAKADHDEDDVPAQEDLATVLRTNPSRYRVIIGRIQDSNRVDDDGYASIPELLEQTHALDPTRPEHLRLSNRALARVVLDVQGSDPPYPNWVGNTNRGDWKRLLASEDLQATIDEVEQLLANDEPIAVFNQKPFRDTEKGEDDSDYEIDGLPTIRPPTPTRKQTTTPPPPDKAPEDKPHESSDDEDDEADSRTNDKADKDAAATPASSSGTKTPSPGDDKSSDKGHDKGCDKYLRKTL